MYFISQSLIKKFCPKYMFIEFRIIFWKKSVEQIFFFLMQKIFAKFIISFYRMFIYY